MALKPSIKVIIMCKGKWLNRHSSGGLGDVYNNPFGEHIPMAGDIIEFEGSYYGEENSKHNTEGKQYVVDSRFFKAYETFDNQYTKQQVIITVSEI